MWCGLAILVSQGMAGEGIKGGLSEHGKIMLPTGNSGWKTYGKEDED
jgi:hypothetical protein